MGLFKTKEELKRAKEQRDLAPVHLWAKEWQLLGCDTLPTQSGCVVRPDPQVRYMLVLSRQHFYWRVTIYESASFNHHDFDDRDEALDFASEELRARRP